MKSYKKQIQIEEDERVKIYFRHKESKMLTLIATAAQEDGWDKIVITNKKRPNM